MTNIMVVEVKTKKEIDDMFRKCDMEWKRQQKRIRKILNGGY